MTANAHFDDREILKETMEDTILADQLGDSSIWFGELHSGRDKAFFGRCSHPEVLMSRLIGETHSIRLGTGVKLLPLDEPARFAETAMLLNALAPGRIDLGIGMGMRSIKADAHHDKEAEFIAKLGDLLGLLDGGKAAEQRVIPWIDVDFLPQIWIASREKASLEFAADRHLSLVLGQLEEASQQKKYIDTFRQHPSTGKVKGVRFVHVCQDKNEVWPNIERTVTRMYSKRKTSAYGLQALREKRISIKDSDDRNKQLADCHFIAGTPDYVFSKLSDYTKESGIDALDLIMHIPEVGVEETRRSMTLFASEILPKMKNLQACAAGRWPYE
mgnify:CR=1 FL=1